MAAKINDINRKKKKKEEVSVFASGPIIFVIISTVTLPGDR